MQMFKYFSAIHENRIQTGCCCRGSLGRAHTPTMAC